jgi:sarcosine oxidase/L-pipecolate oxidase
MNTSKSSPSEIVIVGAGVFGLSTARALLRRPKYENTTITILDAASELPNASSASADTSRILRADYALKPYTRLVSDAQKLWKDLSNDGWGGQGRYHPAKIVVTDQPGTEGHVDGYLDESLKNVKILAATGNYAFKPSHLRELRDKEAVKQETGLPGVSGNAGYANDNCGWVNASACVKFVLESLQQAGEQRIRIRSNSRVRRLLYEPISSSKNDSPRCCGVELEDGSLVRADLVILTAGAWTPSLVDLRGQAMATGQVLAYLSLSKAEQKALDSMPVYFNVSRGMYMIPANNGELKLGRHGFGYQNPTKVSWATGDGKTMHALVSTPRTDLPVPAEAEAALKEFLVELFPQWKKRQFLKTRVCWYCDT